MQMALVAQCFLLFITCTSVSGLDFLSVLEEGLDNDVDSDDVEALAGGVAPSGTSLPLLLKFGKVERVWGFLYPCKKPRPLGTVFSGEPGALVARDQVLESALPSTAVSQES